MNSQDVPSAHLPQYVTPLIGRNRTAHAALELLQTPTVRLLTLVGESGTGKTRLSLQIAESLRDEFADGQYFVALAPVDNPAFVLPTIAHALGIAEVGDADLSDTIVQLLQHKTLLLLLDNFEQVNKAAPHITTLLEHTAGLKIIVTSQVELGIAQETVFSVPPLAVPLSNTDMDPKALLQFSAVALFVDRMQAIQPKFVLNKQQAPAVIEICRLVQGLPLAIELIAAHSAALSPSDLLMIVRHHLALSRVGGTKGSRSRILHPVLDWCYSRLDTGTQTLLTLLGVFVGGCTAEAVEYIYQAVDAVPIQPKNQLTVLVDKHLVLEEQLPGQTVRYIMLDAIHEYAHGRLHKLKDYSAVSNQHATYYVQLTEQAKESLQGTAQREWTQRLSGEIHNIRAALRWSLQPALAEQALRLCANLWRFWYSQGYLTEGRRWLEQALQNNQDPQSRTLGDALNALGILAWAQSDYEQSQSYLEQSAALLRQQGSSISLARTLNNLGIMTHSQTQYEVALGYYQESLAIFEQLNEQTNIALTSGNIGLVLADLGRSDEARHAQDYSLRLNRELGNAGGIADTLHNLAYLAKIQGDYGAAEDYLVESLALHRQIEEKNRITYSLAFLAEVKTRQGHFAEAQRLLLEALRTQHEISDKDGLSNSLIVGALLLLRNDKTTYAAQLCGLVQHIRQLINAPLINLDQHSYDEIIDACQQAIGHEQWHEHWQHGASISIDAAIGILEDLEMPALPEATTP